MGKALAPLALLFLLSHLLWLPSTFADIDALNFALGVRDFDVAAHQPHPPGYPVFVGAAKLSTGLMRAAGISSAEVRGLAVWSALAGTLAIPLLFLSFRSYVRDAYVAAWTTLVVAVSPVFWFTALRPLSDMAGLTVALAAQVLLLAVLVPSDTRSRPAFLVAGAFVAGLAIGVRSQTFLLTLPLLGLAVILPQPWMTYLHRLLAIAAVLAGVLAWAVPLVITSGGVEAYLGALGNQAGEDFTGAVMFWTSRTPRVLLNALQYSFLWPWGGLWIGGVVLAVALVGGVRMLAAQRFGVVLLVAAFVPYAALQLIFQETVMTRYALPLVVPVAVLAVYGLGMLGRRAVAVGCLLYVATSLMPTFAATHTYARTAAPGAQIVSDAVAMGDEDPIAMHAVMLRHEQWYHDNASGRVTRSRHGREVLGLVDLWRERPDAAVNFMADPARSDLAMLDVHSRKVVRYYDLGFPEMPYVGGVRPRRLQLYRMNAPGWMLDQGWAVTAEVAGQSNRAGARPEVRPSIAWVRSRPESTVLLLGGRHLGPGDAPPATLTVALPDRVIESFDIESGFFLRRIALPAGALSSPAAYVPLSVGAVATAPGDVRVSLEQFDLQREGVPMLGFLAGWQEPEYNRITGAAWRWASARNMLWVRPIGRDVALTIHGESPLKYFEEAPLVRISIGETLVEQRSPSSDFVWRVTLPEGLLAQHDGQVVLESDRWFVPGEGGAGGDLRQLALRIYSIFAE